MAKVLWHHHHHHDPWARHTFDNEYDKERNNSTMFVYINIVNQTAESNIYVVCTVSTVYSHKWNPTHATTFCGRIKLGKCQLACWMAKYIICLRLCCHFLIAVHSLFSSFHIDIYFFYFLFSNHCICAFQFIKSVFSLH